VRPHVANAPDWLTARPIAHRGLHDLARGVAENSLGALRAAMAKAYAVEADLRLSRDGQAFVFHDDELDRLTGESGLFGARDSAELAGIGLRGAGERAPTLAAFLAAASGAVPLILELKGDFTGDVALAAAVAAELTAYSGPVAVKSFDPAPIGDRGAGSL
jgi:glycerophosphoryl diester phosphodiesterase